MLLYLNMNQRVIWLYLEWDQASSPSIQGPESAGCCLPFCSIYTGLLKQILSIPSKSCHLLFLPGMLSSFRSLLQWQQLRKGFPDPLSKVAPPRHLTDFVRPEAYIIWEKEYKIMNIKIYTKAKLFRIRKWITTKDKIKKPTHTPTCFY